MRFAILTQGNRVPGIDNYESLGFYQWLHVFGGRIVEAEEALTTCQDGAYDLILIRLIEENLALIPALKERLGRDSFTKLAVCLDIPVPYWESEFTGAKHLDALKTAVAKADFVFGTDFQTAQALEAFAGRTVYEIPYPVNLDKLKACQHVIKKKVISILHGRPQNVMKSLRGIRGMCGRDLNMRVLSYRCQNQADIDFYQQKKIETILCRNEQELGAKLAESELIVIPEKYPFCAEDNHHLENLVVYAAALGTIVLGGVHLEAMRRCYPDLAYPHLPNNLYTYRWLKKDTAKITNVVENAKTKAEYYQGGNLRKRFLDLLYAETKEPRFLYRAIQTGPQPLFEQIHHVYGERSIKYHPEEFVVVCLVKNGADYIRVFLDYYRKMGTRHFFFIDNGSTDGTMTLLKQCPDVTLYETKLPHKKYESEIRRAVIEEHCRNNWLLCVDIDEFFDYPYSERISMGLFLRYLNSHHYTAVMSYLLDMFSREVEFTPQGEEDLVSRYCYYDVSNVRKHRYDVYDTPYTNYNQLADPKMRHYSGGIRSDIFKNKTCGYLLSKHPLIFVNSKIEPAIHPHYCNKAFVADVQGVLKHYKFIGSFKDKVIHSLEAKDYCYYAELEYQEYYNVIKDKSKMSLYSRKSKKLETVDQLIREGFLRVSKAYRAYVKEAGQFKPESLSIKGRGRSDTRST